jgi:DNA-binding NtrC family response regulator
MRVGSTTPIETDVRVIAATNRTPEQAVSSGKLREDLYYRLNVFPLTLPPLRERATDVPLLAEHFLAAVCEREKVRKRFTPAALEKLTAYCWPGNVRELRNVVQRAFVMAEGEQITDEWLPSGSSMAAAHGDETVLIIKVGTSMAEMQRQLALATLHHCKQHKEKTAAVLDISLKTLYKRLKEYAAAGWAPADAGHLDGVAAHSAD